MELKILYEDKDIAVIDKPAGISVHPSPAKPEEKTLVDFILKRWPEIRNVGEEPLRPGIVHRLDKETSGVLVIAKNQGVFFHLKKQFQERKVEKTYLALVFGKMPKIEGRVDLSIARSRRFGKFTTKIQRGKISGETFPKQGREREAATWWKVLREYRTSDNDLLTLLEVKPETGRTHQIRVHFSAIGHPVIADPLYGGKKIKSYRKMLKRMFLHAKGIKIRLPRNKIIFVESDLPPDLERFLAGLEAISQS
jgi:23S rRNA pseudouridine1911/1915/1917 synthase